MAAVKWSKSVKQAHKEEVMELAQDTLMSGMQTAFCDESLSPELHKEMTKQFARVERLFGYEPYSWARGV